MKIKPIVFLFLSICSGMLAILFALSALFAPNSNRMGVPVSLIFGVLLVTNGYLYRFAKELIEKLDKS